MELVTRRDWIEHLIARATGSNVTLFAPCVESTAEAEGILLGAEDFAVEHEIDQLPLMIGFAATAPANPQLLRVSPSGVSQPDGSVENGDEVAGFQIMEGMLKTYASIRGLFHRVVVMLYVDRTLPNADREIIENTHFLRELAMVVCDHAQEPADAAAAHVKSYQDLYGDLVLVQALTGDTLTADSARAFIEGGHADFVSGPADAAAAKAIADAVGKKLFLRQDALGDFPVEALPEAGVVGLHVPCLDIEAPAVSSGASPARLNDALRRRYAEATKGYLGALGYARLGQPAEEEGDEGMVE